MMDMQAIGTKRDLIEISTKDFSIYISGNTTNKKYSVTNNNKNVSAQFVVESLDYDNIQKKSINSFKELEVNNTDLMVPSFFEDGIYDIYFETDTDDTYEIYHCSREIRSYGTFMKYGVI